MLVRENESKYAPVVVFTARDLSAALDFGATKVVHVRVDLVVVLSVSVRPFRLSVLGYS